MFSLRNDGLVFEQDEILENLLSDSAPLEKINQVTENKGAKKKQTTSEKNQENKNEGSGNNNNDSKKTMHRDIERQRRQEMSSLYASLRSLLPLEYIKGKRSTSDHILQAVNYIKDMQRKIEELQIRRDELGKITSTDITEDQKSNSNICVKVNLSREGMEILMSTNKQGFPLSKVLADLLARGLNIISCVSTTNDEWALHKIQIEANGLTSIDVSELQERLVNLIKFA